MNYIYFIFQGYQTAGYPSGGYAGASSYSQAGYTGSYPQAGYSGASAYSQGGYAGATPYFSSSLGGQY